MKKLIFDRMNTLTVKKKFPLELVIWVLALIVLYLLDSHEHGHATLCPLARTGIDCCPGCGLGRSIHLVLHGEFKASFAMHWLGIPTLLVLLYRIYSLFVNYIKN